MLGLLLTPAVLSILRIFISTLIQPIPSYEIVLLNENDQNGQLGTSDEEKNAITELRALLSDLLHEDEFYTTDNFMLRWLKARDLNATAANRMARDARDWRIRNNIESIMNETVMTFSTNPYEIKGHDKEGRPLVFFALKHIDVRKIMVTGNARKGVRMWDQMLERAYNVVKNSKHLLTNGEPVTNFVAIFDMEGLSLRQHLCLRCFSIYLQCAQHLERYYPGAVHSIIVINMNRFSMPILDITLPVFSAPIRNTFKYFGTNRTEWSEYLLSVISPDQLPLHYRQMRLN